jgi:hypothetical protein
MIESLQQAGELKEFIPETCIFKPSTAGNVSQLPAGLTND